MDRSHGDEMELQQRLTRLADRTAPPPRAELAELVVARHGRQRRQAVGITALAAAVAAVVIAVPTLIGGFSDSPTATAVGGNAAVDEGWLSAPTRGSLSGDAAFVEGVRQLPWTSTAFSSDVPDAPLETRHVLYVGEFGGSRFAVVAGENTTQLEGDPEQQTDLGALSDQAIAWFLGPSGAAPEDMVLQSVPRGADSYGGPAAFLDSATGALVVLGAAGDQVSLSLRPVVSADGSVARDYEPLPAADGVAETIVPEGARSVQSLRYRVVRGSESWTSGPTASAAEPAAVPAVTWLRTPPPASHADLVADALPNRLLDALGLTADQVGFTMVWSGDVPSPTENPSRVALLASTLPSGAVYLQCSIGLAFADGSAGGTECGSEIRAAGVPLDEQTFALRVDATDMGEQSEVVSSLVLVAPSTATSARALDLDGVALAEFPLTDGVAVQTFPERTATVETLAADGTVLQSTRPITQADLGD